MLWHDPQCQQWSVSVPERQCQQPARSERGCLLVARAARLSRQQTNGPDQQTDGPDRPASGLGPSRPSVCARRPTRHYVDVVEDLSSCAFGFFRAVICASWSGEAGWNLARWRWVERQWRGQHMESLPHPDDFLGRPDLFRGLSSQVRTAGKIKKLLKLQSHSTPDKETHICYNVERNTFPLYLVSLN